MIRTLVVDHDVAGLARSLGADHALHANNLSDARILLLGDVDLQERHDGISYHRCLMGEQGVCCADIPERWTGHSKA
jgi:hypothetical protein